MEVIFTIDEAKKQRVIDAMKGLHPIPMPFIDPNDPSSGRAPAFTDAQWAKEAVRRWVVRQVHSYERRVAQQDVEKDDEIIQ